VVVIGLGALTNVAEALALDPGIVSNMVRTLFTKPEKDARLINRASRFVTRTHQRLVYMGMGHRMKEPQTEDFPFKAPTEPFEPDHGMCSTSRVRVQA
jgi:hypothetical protein